MKRSFLRCLASAAFCGAAVFLFAACGKPEPPAQKPISAKQARPKAQEAEIVVRKGAVVKEQGHLSDLSFGAVPVKAGEEKEQRKVHVQADHILRMSPEHAAAAAELKMLKKTKWKIVFDTPADSMAEKLFDRENAKTRLIWTPLECSSSIDPIRIPDVTISPDGSVILFVETTGDAAGPFGSRIVMMNTYNWHFLRVAELPERFIDRIVWLPGTTSAAALCRPQKGMKQAYGVAIFDLISGKETAFAEIPEDAGKTAFLADGNGRILLSRAKEPSLLALDAATLKTLPVSPVSVAVPNAILSVSNDGKYLAVSADHAKFIEILKISDLHLLSRVAMPENFPLNQIHFLPGDQKTFNFFLCGRAGSAVENVMILSGRTRVLNGNASGLGKVSADGSMLFNVLSEQNRISVVDVQSGSETQCIESNKSQPKMTDPGSGTIRFLFQIPHAKGLAVFDTQGNFYLISSEKGTKRYAERAIIFQRRK